MVSEEQSYKYLNRENVLDIFNSAKYLKIKGTQVLVSESLTQTVFRPSGAVLGLRRQRRSLQRRHGFLVVRRRENEERGRSARVDGTANPGLFPDFGEFARLAGVERRRRQEPPEFQLREDQLRDGGVYVCGSVA